MDMQLDNRAKLLNLTKSMWEDAEEEIREAHRHATRLLLVLMEKHFPGQSIEPLDTICGVIDQIDHITVGLVVPTPGTPT